MYRHLIKPILFLFPPESVHNATTQLLKIILKIPLLCHLVRHYYRCNDPSFRKEVFGLTFPNRVGLAAGFDKNAKYVDEMAGLGFGFVEIGTLTPKPQTGNEKPRLFRLPKDEALINRMGFNNIGVADAVKRLKNRRSDIIVGGNIGKNKTTPNENAIEDYEYCYNALHEVVDYFVVNVSSPNTPELRDLQEKQPLQKLLSRLKDLSVQKKSTKPILLKIAPDLNNNQLDDILAIVEDLNIDGIIATNTTIEREPLDTSKEKISNIGPGGLSGKPLSKRSNEIIRYIHGQLPQLPIIGVGGIMTEQDAIDKIRAGAILVQIYTGFVYRGPSIIKGINKKLSTMNSQSQI